MGRAKTKRSIYFVWVIFLACLLMIYLRSFQPSTFSYHPILPDAQCRCVFNDGLYDFCYHLPLQPEVRGRPFNCTYASYLDRLDLLATDSAFDLKKDRLPDPMFVTAMSTNHFKEGLTLIANIRKLWPQKKIVVYDLGLSQESVQKLKGLCSVELRDFPFSNFPPHVRNLEEYRWKPIIIAMAVKEYGAIWWMDTSVRWLQDYRNLVYDEITCQETSPAEEFLSWLGFAQKSNVTDCDKSSYLLQRSSEHSIYATTNPGMYDYIPTIINNQSRKSCENYDANFAFIVKTKETISILKWLVLCALEMGCMAPPGSQLNCNFNGDRYTRYANCHRYDQSAINLLLANMYGCNSSKYVSRYGSEGAKIERFASNSLTEKDFLCT
ncbi:hypothetical protein V3C99_007150 [Haemonchus contortus]